ncbi:hypothetical protein ASF58_23430 [Methylobacterium sp. Leaf125]|uniref:hypothetical protein n=1 Tax=Methylobacterium sp. Leaf125 TaxID=1736265 RepID=UPI0006FBD491|nr:hypothetical protein [Methylobacterium sp. Leaf125]KQQ37523.1 hypothetical protein ASF58_23430 [Methylobacterium sp. Leaf125]
MVAQAARRNGAIALLTSSWMVFCPLEWPEQPSEAADVVVGGMRFLLNLSRNFRFWLVHPAHDLDEK